jgi:hypothetical protein
MELSKIALFKLANRVNGLQTSKGIFNWRKLGTEEQEDFLAMVQLVAQEHEATWVSPLVKPDARQRIRVALQLDHESPDPGSVIDVIQVWDGLWHCSGVHTVVGWQPLSPLPNG